MAPQRTFKTSFGEYTRVDDAMKMPLGKARKLAALCRKHRVMYGRAGSYPAAIHMAYKRGLRTLNGMPYHKPNTNYRKFYLIWRGEDDATVTDAIAFLLMLSPDQIMLIPDTITSQADVLKYTSKDYQYESQHIHETPER